MNDIIELLNKILNDDTLISVVLSKLKNKNTEFNKIDIKPVLIKDEKMLQITFNYNNKVTHKNINYYNSSEEIFDLIDKYFKHINIFTTEADYEILISKKGKYKVLKKKPSKSIVNLSHNRKKKYIIEENIPCPFLIRLGVMNKQGKVFSNKYDKFRQINRFLEMISDTFSKIEINEQFNIIDFGCGKSYLTFALYYYLKERLNLNVNIIGLDLKKDVISFCNDIATDLNYDNLKFIHGDIKDYNEINKVDMVVTLHACDIATDAAIVKAINWNAKIIMSVPCCQHEFFKKINNETLNPMLKHGIIKEKLSSLVTDSLRANVLEILGYSTQILEFIDMEHTPKNLLIRAIKSDKNNKNAVEEYKKFKEFWNINNLYIEDALGSILEDKLK